jgi:Spy/CpxP family protein refolding chaperone
VLTLLALCLHAAVVVAAAAAAAVAAAAAGSLAWRQVLGGFHEPLQQDITAAQQCSTTQVGATVYGSMLIEQRWAQCTSRQTVHLLSL